MEDENNKKKEDEIEVITYKEDSNTYNNNYYEPGQYYKRVKKIHFIIIIQGKDIHHIIIKNLQKIQLIQKGKVMMIILI